MKVSILASFLCSYLAALIFVFSGFRNRDGDPIAGSSIAFCLGLFGFSFANTVWSISTWRFKK